MTPGCGPQDGLPAVLPREPVRVDAGVKEGLDKVVEAVDAGPLHDGEPPDGGLADLGDLEEVQDGPGRRQSGDNINGMP